jgi:hypothetical protein
MGANASQENVSKTINKMVFNAFAKVATNIFTSANSTQTLTITCCEPSGRTAELIQQTCRLCTEAETKTSNPNISKCIPFCSVCSQTNNVLSSRITVNASAQVTTDIVNQVVNELKTQAGQNFSSQTDFVSADTVRTLTATNNNKRNLNDITNDITNNLNTQVLTEMKTNAFAEQNLKIGDATACSAAGSQAGNTLSTALELASSGSISVASYNDAVSKAATEISQTLESKDSTLGALDTFAASLGLSIVAFYAIVGVIVLVLGFFVVRSVFRSPKPEARTAPSLS